MPRAPRFPIRTPLRYRRSGGRNWIESQTVNISRSGILFRADAPLDPKTAVEMKIVFPPEITGGDPVNVVCWGIVVRTEAPSPPETHTLMAATIIRHRFYPQ